MNTETAKPLRVTVLAGGPSAEREVSLWSGRAIAEALQRRGHAVFMADIGPDNLAALDEPCDVLFPALHGTFGEDGTLQKILEQRRIRFVGSGSGASATAIDKVRTKQCVVELKLPTPDSELVTVATVDRPRRIGAPAVVKPVDSGSSVATTIVPDEPALRDAVRDVVTRFGRALVEQFIAGDELTVGILGGRSLPPICIRPKRAFYDYEAKYLADDTEYLFEPGCPAAVLDQARAWSEQIFAALGCRHLGRLDWMLDRQHRLWFLEVNTLPGFTSHSLVPKAAAHVGIGFDELCDRLVRMAYAEVP